MFVSKAEIHYIYSSKLSNHKLAMLNSVKTLYKKEITYKVKFYILEKIIFAF